MALVLFDVDGTLLDGASSERRFIRHLAASGLLGPHQMIAALHFALREAFRGDGAPLKRNKAYLTGLETARIEALARDFVVRTLLPSLRPVLHARIEAHLAAGDTVALLTGTPDFLAAPLAERLGIPHCIATRCATVAGRFTAAAPRTHPYAVEKLRLATELAEMLDLPLGEAFAYADSNSDRALLEAVGHAVAVAPDPWLAAVARGQGWVMLVS